jgi:tetratricopeptide (TPR) repeat protein
MFYTVAAVGCGLVLFQLLHGASSNHLGGNAPLGSLQHAALVPTPRTGTDVAGTLPANRSTATEARPSSPAKHPAATALSNRTPSTARPGEHEREQVGDTDQSRAQLLVEEGMALFKDGRLGLAEASYLKALKNVPGYPRAMAALVRVHIQRRDGAEAVRWAEQLVAKHSNDPVSLLLLGDAQQLRGDITAAQDAWTEAARNGSAAARQRLRQQ